MSDTLAAILIMAAYLALMTVAFVAVFDPFHKGDEEQ